ncbi:MAG: hypothetical protein ACKOX6_03010 [Bdellovibrio sp.]
MYRTWDNLVVRSESELKDPARLRCLNRGHIFSRWAMIIGFACAGLMSLSIMGALLWVFAFEKFELKGAMAALFMLVLGAIFFWGSFMFKKDLGLDPIQGFLKHPEKYQFIPGKLTSSYYSARDRRQQSMIVAEGEAELPSGTKLPVHEEFHYSIWPFTNRENEAHMNPVSAHFICEKENPSWARMVGIDKAYLTLKD